MMNILGGFVFVLIMLVGVSLVLIIMASMLYTIINPMNKWLFKGKIRLRYRMLFSCGIPVFLICMYLLHMYYVPYSSYFNDKRLKDIGITMTLPSYEITCYTNDRECVEGNEILFHYYEMRFKDEITPILPFLDSLCNSNDNWKKIEGDYYYSGNGRDILDRSLIIYPKSNRAVFSTNDVQSIYYYLLN